MGRCDGSARGWMHRRYRRLFGLILIPLLFLAACSASAPSADKGITAIAPLEGDHAVKQRAFVERLRYLPRSAALERRSFVRAGGKSSSELKYLFFKPKGFDPQQRYPLVLSLHGGAPRRHFEDLVQPFLPGLAYGLGRLVADETQDQHPCFVVAPWSNNGNWNDDKLARIMELLAALQMEFPVDTNRIYVTGQSMGGWGTWSIITQYPDRFAAAVPICGGGNPRLAARATRVAIWAFHGTADGMVPVRHTREMIAALRQAGGAPRYWEYQGAEHSGTAERAYSEPDLVEWLFGQKL